MPEAKHIYPPALPALSEPVPSTVEGVEGSSTCPERTCPEHCRGSRRVSCLFCEAWAK